VGHRQREGLVVDAVFGVLHLRPAELEEEARLAAPQGWQAASPRSHRALTPEQKASPK